MKTIKTVETTKVKMYITTGFCGRLLLAVRGEKCAPKEYDPNSTWLKPETFGAFDFWFTIPYNPKAYKNKKLLWTKEVPNEK